ncbi:DNA topoisomerase [Rhizobium sp. BK176]|uniref:DNA topoisomerase n=1 Tax=Rhizobium sp. BK176 TaxID=2587071 RepID=UPI00216A7E3C|nr:DNA topoisomerase [Rhizobium sp. BK176]MCS4088439.1 hypothetical protein [Rhizobium sp. BK176]
MSSSGLVSHGLNLHDLVRICATRFDMPPAATRSAAERLYENNTITYPRTEFRFLGDDDHVDGSATLAMLAASSPIWEAQVEKTDPKYQSSVWVNEKVAREQNARAIVPLKRADVASFDRDEENVFSVVAERYIALFDPARSTSRDREVTEENFEYRHFRPAAHVNKVDVFGTSVDLVGPEFYVDNRGGSLFLAVTDDVKGYAWLEVPLAALSEFICAMPFSSTEDFARRNLVLLRKFVDEANNTVLPGGGGLYVCAAKTYEIRDGVRHYKWPRS